VGAVGGYTFTAVSANHTIEAAFALNPPVAAITDLSAAQVRAGNDPGSTTRIQLSWTPTPAGTVVKVYRAVFGHYPEYDQAGGAAPVAPGSYPPGAGWTLTDVNAPGGTDLAGVRDFYYFVAYVQDGYGTWSAVSNLTAGTLNYHLGDISDGTTPGVGNDHVSLEDLSLLGANYGITLATGDPLDYLDFGPTTDGSAAGRPTPDKEVEFEDLVLLALNYDRVSKAPGKPAAATADELILEAPAAVQAGDPVEARFRLSGTGLVAGLSVLLRWDAAVVVPDGVSAGSLAETNGGVVLSAKPGSVDAAVLGASAGGFTGQGELAVIHFRAVASGNPAISIASVRARDMGNRPATLHTSETASTDGSALPSTTQLLPASPNPLRGSTELRYRLSAGGSAELLIFSPAGRLVRTLAQGRQAAGEYAAVWDGRDDAGRALASGLYFVRLRAANREFVGRLTLLR
jgi:hypothetical protein